VRTPSAWMRTQRPRICGLRERCDWVWGRVPFRCPHTPARMVPNVWI